MKLKLLVASNDRDYLEHLSSYFSNRYASSFEVTAISGQEHFEEVLKTSRFDVALLDFAFATSAELSAVRLPLVLAEDNATPPDVTGFTFIRKYQRISSMVGDILEAFAGVIPGVSGFDTARGQVTAVWSPAGGVGKTSVALACAAHKVFMGKQVVYLNLENFSSTYVYFNVEGKSISKAFEKLDIKSSNPQLLLKGIRQQDSGSGIFYFCGPDNYDDINILTQEDIETLVNACAMEADELVIDLSSLYNANIQKVFDLANRVLLVVDPSTTSQTKLHQFINQHNAFVQIQSKAVLVNNRGAKVKETSIEKTISLPLISTSDPVSVFKGLSSGDFR